MSADVVIRGGTVHDGTGAPGRRADVAITDGRVSAIGDGLAGRRELDASGCVVAPGFIDIHTHYDAQVFWDPALTPSCYHGVTTVVAGNCGFSIAPTRPGHRELIARTLENVEDMDVAALAAGIPWDFETFPEYLASIERRGTALNYAAYIGHTALRLFVMGDAAYERAATADEIERMAATVGEAMEAGAAGFASSFAMTHIGVDGKPIPSRWAERDEIVAMFRAVAATRRGVLAVTPGGNLAIDELYPLSRELDAPFTYTALLTNHEGRHRRNVELNEAGWAEGGRVFPQVSPRPLIFAMTLADPFTLNPNPVFAELMKASLAERRAAYADPSWRAKAFDAFDSMTGMKPRWDTYAIAESAAHPELVDKRVVALAAERGVTPLDVVLDVALDEPDLMLRVKATLANDDPDEVMLLLRNEHCALGLSDAGAHVGQLCDAPQATDFLGNWVRDRGAMPMEAAVRKLTGAQADLFGFADRGYLREGACADVAVFDPATVAPGPIRRVADFPAGSERLTADAPTGMRHVVVNGTPIVADGAADTEAMASRPGRIARPAVRG